MATPEQVSPDLGAASFTALLRELDDERVNREALQVTIAFTRAHPCLWGWFHHPGQDSAHDEVARRWRQDPAIVRATPHKPHRAQKYLDHLLGAAERFLDAEDERLAAAYQHATSSPAWAELPQSARDLYAALHGQARERGKPGGPNVLMCHTLAANMIEVTTGRRYRSKATITNAREALIAAGFITAKVGEPWQPGVKSRPTVYSLLPASVLSELSLSPHRGIVHFADTRSDTRPRWTDRHRYVFGETVSALAEGRRKAEIVSQAAPADSLPSFELVDFDQAIAVTGGDAGAPFDPAIAEEAVAVIGADASASFDELMEGSNVGTSPADAAASAQQ